MSEENENEFERDFSEENSSPANLNEETTDLNEDRGLEANEQDTKKEIDPIAEANESLITMDPAPFDKTLEAMSQTLASIDNKMDLENLQLQKLDQLFEIKDQLDRLENISSATPTIAPEPATAAEPEAVVEEAIPENNIGHNQQEISELLEKIDTLEKKIINIENQSNNSNERFEKIENVVERFEDLESEIQVEYEEEEKPGLFKNLFKKKEKTKPYKNDTEISTPQINLTKIKEDIPKNTENFIEEAETSIKNDKDEIIINEDTNNINDSEVENENNEPNKLKKSTGKNILVSILLILVISMTSAFVLDSLRIIDLDIPIGLKYFSGWADLFRYIF